MSAQYSSYLVFNTTYVNGNRTIGENIADNGGLRLALRAQSRSPNAEVVSTPAFTFNDRQVLLTRYAQNWCGSATVEDEVKQTLTGVHTINRYRILGALQNMEEFASAFKCKVGDFYNPGVRNVVW